MEDWTESTDYIPRIVGGTALVSWLQYIGFPKWYRRIIIIISQLDYDVEEILEDDWTQGKKKMTKYEGKVTEGFMMGNPLTKTILHLMHDVNIGTVHSYMNSMGIRVRGFREVVTSLPLRESIDLNDFYLDSKMVSNGA